MATLSKKASPAKTPAPAKAKAAAPRGKAVTKAAVAPVQGKPAKPTKPAKPAVKKAQAEGATKVAKTRAAAPVKSPPVKSQLSAAAPIPEEQRRHYIEVAAYYIAQRRGFFGARALEDWTQAEAEVDRMLREGKLNP